MGIVTISMDFIFIYRAESSLCPKTEADNRSLKTIFGRNPLYTHQSVSNRLMIISKLLNVEENKRNQRFFYYSLHAWYLICEWLWIFFPSELRNFQLHCQHTDDDQTI